MRNFKITVNGKPYDVQVEEVGEKASVPSAPVKADTTPAPAPVKPVEAGEGQSVKAPMPGTILKIQTSVGDTVKNGQVLVVLEAMKMENDITSPADGTVTSILVKQGDSVDGDTVLLTIK